MSAHRLALLLLLLALAGCGADGPSPANVVRAWSSALNAGDNERAAGFFAKDAQIVQGGSTRRLHTHRQAVLFNAGLPCSGRIVELDVRGDEVEATFVLGDRPQSPCDGPGERAAVLVRVHDGRIALWHQIGALPEPDGSNA